MTQLACEQAAINARMHATTAKKWEKFYDATKMPGSM
jgi:hypothetical protein